MKKYFLYGYYGFGNLGDDLLLSAIIKNIRNEDADAKFVIRSFNEGPILGKNIVYTCIDRILNNKRQSSKVKKFISYALNLVRYVRNCDTVIVGGGTLIHDTHSMGNLLIIFFMVLFSKLYQKHVYFIGIGIANLNYNMSKRLLKMIVKMSEFFCVRDEESYKELLVNRYDVSKVVKTNDLVYTLWNPLYKKRAKKDYVCNNIGITLVDGSIDNKKIENVIVPYVNALLKNKANKIILMPFHNMKSTDYIYTVSDIDIMYRIKDRIASTQIDIRPVSLNNYLDVYKDLDFVVGMRFHSLVLAAMHSIPFLGIIHDNKIKDICDVFEMDSINVEKINFDELYKKTENMLVKEINFTTLERMQKNAMKNFDFIKGEK